MQTRAPVLLTRLRRTVPREALRVLDHTVAVATEAAIPAYLVGGSVRDLLLRRTSPDLDLTFEGDAPALARQVAERAGLHPPRVHPAFGTATLHSGDVSLDFITARAETYAAPGALPSVTPATLAVDLARRDFTINALALGLSGPDAGSLFDPHGGLADLRAGLLRVLHARSFADDPTRLLRAARYAARFRFALEEQTEAQIVTYRSFLDTISPARIRHELVRTFAERRPASALALIERYGLAERIYPPLRYHAGVRAALRRLLRAPEPYQETPWLLPALAWDAGTIAGYIARLDLSHHEATAARALPAAWTALTHLASADPRPSEIVAALERLPPATLAAWAAGDPRARRVRLARRYLHELRAVRPRLRAADLQAHGLAPGPRFGDLLRALRAARLDGTAPTLDAERRLMHDILSRNMGV